MRTFRFLAILLSCAIPMLAQSAEVNLPATGGNAIASTQPPMTRRASRQPFQAQPSNGVPSETEVPKDAAVLTMEGVCDGPHKTAKSSACKTVVTRAELDGLVNALMPEASQTVRSQFAVNYARMLAAAEVAKRRHLEQDAAVAKEILAQEKMARMRVLASSLYKMFEAQADKISPAEVKDYYAAHTGDFEAGEIERLSLSKLATTASGQPVDVAAAKTMAEALRTRAAAGEDLNQLQQEGYKQLGIQITPPPVKPLMMRRKNLTPDQTKVFDQKPGEISEVVDTPGAFIIQRLVAKNSVSLDEERAEIEALLRRQHIQQNLREAEQSVKADFNLKYFDIASAPELFPLPGTGQVTPRSRMSSTMRPRFARPGMPMAAPMAPQR
jgi:PPIC-type PPIASE domain